MEPMPTPNFVLEFHKSLVKLLECDDKLGNSIKSSRDNMLNILFKIFGEVNMARMCKRIIGTSETSVVKATKYFSSAEVEQICKNDADSVENLKIENFKMITLENEESDFTSGA